MKRMFCRMFLVCIVLVMGCRPVAEPTLGPTTIAIEPTVATKPPELTPTLTATIPILPAATIAPTVTPTIVANAPSHILYMTAPESDSYGMNANGEGSIYEVVFSDTGSVQVDFSSSESNLLLTTDWGALASSPNGNQILILLYVTSGQLLRNLNLQTNEIVNISDEIGDVKFFNWHPNNQQVLVWKEYNAIDAGLWLVNVKTSEHFTLITSQFIFDNQLGDIGSGAISPDGQTIVYTHRTGIHNSQIWLMDSDGNNRHQIMETLGAGLFSWSPDGQLVAFVAAIGEQFGIFVMREDGSDLRLVSSNYAVGHAFPLSWSPNSQLLAFNGYCEPNAEVQSPTHPYPFRDNPDNHFQHNIQIIDVWGGNEHPLLATDGCGNTDPTWSPDSSQVAFVSFRNGFTEVWAANVDGSNLRQLSNHQGALVRFPIWLPLEVRQ